MELVFLFHRCIRYMRHDIVYATWISGHNCVK
uniref:Uncharacterized protein n=1 Tax=Rhizophora mucronata TaxID=61149 RepID=A0A2P2PQS1_RHIMU